MKIATWNINGIKARIDAATTWLKGASPDIACLQEIKCLDDAFPKEAFEDLGYNVAVHGQKGFNGVALISKLPFDDITPRLAGDPDDLQARYLEACVSVPSGVLRLLNIYLPNGNPPGTEKYVYKLAWMTRLRDRIKTLLANDEPHRYTFWDYQAGAWQKNQGLRIDHLLLSPQAADRLQLCEIDPTPRGWEKPSDHVPIFIELNV